jgi:hypothetical protein
VVFILLCLMIYLLGSCNLCLVLYKVLKPMGEGHSQNVGPDLAILGTLFWECPHFDPLPCISWSLLHILWVFHGLHTLNPNFQVYLHCYHKGLAEISSCIWRVTYIH